MGGESRHHTTCGPVLSSPGPAGRSRDHPGDRPQRRSGQEHHGPWPLGQPLQQGRQRLKAECRKAPKRRPQHTAQRQRRDHQRDPGDGHQIGGKTHQRDLPKFTDVIVSLPQIVECYSVTGDFDYVLKVIARDLKSLSDFLMNKLMHLPGVSDVRSSVCLDEVKCTGALPLPD